MKCSWFNTDDISSYYPKWNVKVDSMYKAFVKHQNQNPRTHQGFWFKNGGTICTSLDIKNEYSRGPLFKFLTEGSLQNTTCSKENKDMNHKIKYAKNDKIKNMLDSWTSEPRIKTIIPKMIKHNGSATIVFWADGTKTVVKANPDLIEEKRVCYLDESGKRHYKTVTIDRTDDSAAVMYAFVKKWVCDNEDTKFHHFLKVVKSKDEK